jgi:hypothetical protein
MYLFFSVVSRWWQAAAQAGSTGSCIPPNKVPHRSFKSGLVDHARLCAVILLVAVVLSWREPKTATEKNTAGSLNKVRVQNFYCCNLLLHLHPPARGGSLESDGRLLSPLHWLNVRPVGISTLLAEAVWSIFFARSGCGGRSWWAVDFFHGVDMSWSCDTNASSTLSAAPTCLPTLKAIWWPLSSVSMSDVSSTSVRRPYAELSMAFFVVSVPSGVVPGAGDDGHGRSSLSFTCGGGPDCIFSFIFRVLARKVRDCVIVFVLFLSLL